MVIQNLNKYVQSFKQDEEKEEGQNGSWSELPQDVLCLVSAHLFIWDLLAFRAICKSWRLITPISRPLLPLMDSPHSQSPCLISLNNHTCKFFHPIQNDTYQMHIPELQGASIRFSKYGWLLLSRKDCSIFFFHPFNRIKIEIPRYPKEDAFQTMCFSSPPDSIDCFVFGITFNGAKFGIIRCGEVYWTIREFIRGFEPYGISSCSPLLYKGKCYWLGHAGRVGVFDLQKYMRALDTNNEYSCRWAYHSSILMEKLSDSLHRSYLLESAGKLLAVFELHDNETSFFIFSLNLSSIRPKMKWHPKRNMGNKLLYLSSGGSFSELAVIKCMRNMIYMPTVQGNSNVFYSFRTKKYHYFCKDHSCRTSSHGEEPINCTWINPMRIDLDEAFEW